MRIDDLHRIPLDTERGDILYEERDGKLILRLKERSPLLDFRDLFTSEEWKALLNKQIVLGEWNPSYRYKEGNIVSYEGELWQSLRNDNLNYRPSEGCKEWRKVVQKGQDGISAEELFQLLGTQELRMEITDNRGGVLLLGNIGSSRMTLKASVYLYFKDLSTHVVKWQWRRITGGAEPTLDTMSADEIWDLNHEELNSPTLEISDEDVVLPSTIFTCTARIEGKLLKAEMKLEL